MNRFVLLSNIYISRSMIEPIGCFLCLNYRDNTAYEWGAISGMVSFYLSIFITKWCNILDWIGLFHRILPTHSLSLQIVFFYTTWISDRDLVPRTGSDRQSSSSRAKTPVSLLFQNSKSNCYSIPLDLFFFFWSPPSSPSLSSVPSPKLDKCIITNVQTYHNRNTRIRGT